MPRTASALALLFAACTAENAGHEAKRSSTTTSALVSAVNPVDAPVLSSEPWAQDRPACTALNGDFLLVWRDQRFPRAIGGMTLTGDIYGARVSTLGQLLDPAGFSITNQNDLSVYPEDGPVVVAGNSQYLAAWRMFGAIADPTAAWRQIDIYGKADRYGGGADEAMLADSLALAFDGTNYLAAWSWPGEGG